MGFSVEMVRSTTDVSLRTCTEDLRYSRSYDDEKDLGGNWRGAFKTEGTPFPQNSQTTEQKSIQKALNRFHVLLFWGRGI